jgi:hypothetical protein
VAGCPVDVLMRVLGYRVRADTVPKIMRVSSPVMTVEDRGMTVAG